MRWFNKIATHQLTLLVIRIIVGGVFLLYGVAKALAPLDQFNQSILDYQLLPEFIVPTFAVVMVIVEIAVGLSLILGIYTRYAALATGALLIVFLIAIGQAMLRGLALPDCGCSGGFIKLGETPVEVFVRDAIMLVMLVPILLKTRAGQVAPWTVDKWFELRRPPKV